MRSWSSPATRQTLTVEWLNFGKHPLPPEVLVVYVTEVRDEEGLLGISFAVSGQLCGLHNAISEMRVSVAYMQRGKARNGTFFTAVSSCRRSV
jgi:hypothetical protein